ncbi:MAG TPA: VOC family protein [Ktedonobacteraceae bacterium]|nr:VOC family protein [Ktedonobacteraceae bacterium]
MHIRELKLLTGRLAEQKEFYTQTLGLPLVNEQSDLIAVQVGKTKLVFAEAQEGSEPYYHFAFNITENKLLQAKAWLAGRNISLSRDDPDNWYSKSWNSNAIYFYDPAGNIVEFIARHDLANAQEGPFTKEDILCVSEIGLVPDNVATTVTILQEKVGVEVYKGSISEEFAALGDEHGLFILSKRGRIWLASDKRSQAHPVDVSIESGNGYNFADLPYTIRALDA